MPQRFSVFDAAAREPQRVALVQGRHEFTYAELAARVTPLCHWLEQTVPEKNAALARGRLPVSFTAPPEATTLFAVYALLASGICFAPLHHRLTRDEVLQLSLRFSPSLELDLELVQELCGSGLSGGVPPSPALPLPAAAPAVVVCTSGSTGLAKAALLSHGALRHAVSASADNLGWVTGDRWLLCLPLAHVGGLSIVLRCLAAQATVVIPERSAGAAAFSIDAIAESIVRDRVTLISLVPTLLARLLAKPGFVLPARVRAILIGGAGVAPDLIDEARRRGFPVLTSYGLTETCSQVTTQTLTTQTPASVALASPARQGRYDSGVPLSGTQVRVDEQGAIQVRTPALFSGYLSAAGLESPTLSDGWFQTHDVGELDSAGRLYVLGRRSDVIVSGGENVYPAEVELCLEQYPGVVAACAFGIPDPEWGQLVAAVFVGSEPEPAELREFLKARLAPHKRPRRLLRVTELPHTASGKLDRKSAAEVFASQLSRPV